MPLHPIDTGFVAGLHPIGSGFVRQFKPAAGGGTPYTEESQFSILTASTGAFAICDRAWTINNGANIEAIGVNVSVNGPLTLGILQRVAVESYDVVYSEDFISSGALDTVQEFALASSYLTPGAGDFHPFVWADGAETTRLGVGEASARAYHNGKPAGSGVTFSEDSGAVNCFYLRVIGTI
jgi:hypothetical protein